MGTLLETDFLIVGSGLAGLSLALRISAFGKVLIVSKAKLQDGNNSWLAQGGIAAAVSHADSIENHIRDTLLAGAGLCDINVVRHVAQQGPDRINDLVRWGVQFDTDSLGNFSLTREGGHSHRRILHVEDHTGREIHKTLLQQAKNHPNIKFLENHLTIDLITKKKLSPPLVGPDRCLGAYVLNQTTEEITPITARATTLAAGGAGKVYLYTSNWSGATGDGIAMAHRVGTRIKDLEFMQFHPTCLYHPQSRNFLISEALRGEGGQLINSQGELFVEGAHPLGGLAPRDIVARSIDTEIKKTGAECVYLDMTHKSEDELLSRFPVIFNRCQQLGINISKDPIPVVPAAHYLCGGVITDLNGRTDIHSLFALGETACTGLHGANRLASNSLLECVVFSANVARYIENHLEKFSPPQLLPHSWSPQNHRKDTGELVVISHMWDEIRRLMWNYMGIVRSHRRLARAQHRLQNIRNEIAEYYSNFKTHTNLVELRNIATVADLSVRCALNRKQSIGIHYNLDDPPNFKNSVTKAKQQTTKTKS